MLELFESYDHPRGRLGRWIQKRVGRQLHAERRWGFRLGGSVFFEERYESGSRMHVFGAATPMDEDRTWFTTALSHPLANVVPQWLLALFGRALNREDRTGTTQLLRRASEEESPISVASDAAALAFRRVLATAKRGESAPLSRFAYVESNRNGDTTEHVGEPAGSLDGGDGGAIQSPTAR
jgi:hypothetical protein